MVVELKSDVSLTYYSTVILTLVTMYMGAYVCAGVGELGGIWECECTCQKSAVPTESELQVVPCLMWVLKIELKS